MMKAVSMLLLQQNIHPSVLADAPDCLGGVFWISSDGDDGNLFLGLKFLIPGFFGVGKFGKYFFGWLDLSGNFSGYSKQSEDSW